MTVWAAKHRKRFLLMTAMLRHCPERIIGDAKTGTHGRSDKWPIECPNSNAHTHAHRDGDWSTMAWDACEVQGFGFKCLHNCAGSEHDDLIYLKMLIENGHLPLAALTDKRFLLPELTTDIPPVSGEDAWPTVFTAADLCDTEAPSRQWVWGSDDTGMIPLGETTLVVGPEGSGKSLWGGQFGRDVSRGKLSSGLVTRKMSVLSVNAEDPIEEIHRRAKKQGVRASDDIRFVSFAGHDATLHPPFPRFGGALVGEDTNFYKFLDHHLGEMGTGGEVASLG